LFQFKRNLKSQKRWRKNIKWECWINMKLCLKLFLLYLKSSFQKNSENLILNDFVINRWKKKLYNFNIFKILIFYSFQGLSKSPNHDFFVFFRWFLFSWLTHLNNFHFVLIGFIIWSIMAWQWWWDWWYWILHRRL